MKTNSSITRLFGLLSLVALLSSCVNLSYEHPMPEQSRVLPEFPENYRGFFAQSEDPSSTLDVYADRFETTEMTGTLGENVEIRVFQKYLVVNIKDEGRWMVILAEKTKEGNIRLYTPDVSDDENVQKLMAITSIEKVMNEEGELTRIDLNPTDQEFKEMVESGLFEPGDDFIPKK